MATKKKQQEFSQLLLHWHQHSNNRSMPWKGEKDPYKIWLSEIILQQTRVEQGLSYYNKFIQQYPTVKKLAAAKDDAVFKLWEGLGYYSRCRNLLHTARTIANECNGIFPTNYDDVLKLKGIGTYTAAAIVSFAYNAPYAVVDGNVYRVLSRVFADSIPIDSNKGKIKFSALAQSLLDSNQPALYNQALMDLGATICKPQLPACEVCPLQTVCKAYQKNTVLCFPVKSKKLEVKTRWMYYLIIEYKNKWLLRQRTEKDIWQNLHEFFLVETTTQQKVDKKQIQKWLQSNTDFNHHFDVVSISNLQLQKLTHRTIKGQFVHIKIDTSLKLNGFSWVNKKDIGNYPFPKFINKYLELV